MLTPYQSGHVSLVSNFITAGHCASIGITKPIIGVVKDPLGFIIELIKG